MARMFGVEVPDNKRCPIGLSYIYGIGLKTASIILTKLNIDLNKKIKDLHSDQIRDITKEINDNYKVEGALRSKIMLDIKRLMDIGCYVGQRHRTGRLTVRGQRTKTNGRTKRGPKKNTIKNKRK